MIISDIRYALRLLSQSPGFSVLTVLVMASGIGLSTYLFSFMHTMVYADLPFEDGQTLMRISRTLEGDLNSGLKPHDMQAIQNQLEGVSEFTRYQRKTMTVSGRDGTRIYAGHAVDASFHGLTRIKPTLGRDFVADDMLQGSANVAIISYRMWQNLFVGRDDVLKQRLRIDGIEHNIVGVMPRNYRFPDMSHIWVPLRANPAGMERHQGPPLYAAYHLLAGHDRTSINRQLTDIMARIEARYPATNTGVGARTHTIPMSTGEGGQPVIYAMHIAAALILLLASVNVGNLLLSRAVERSKETAIRVALGAPRYRLISQMLWESIIVCTVGALIGLMVLGWGLEVTAAVTSRFYLEEAPFWWQFGLDAYTLSIFCSFFVFTFVTTGLLPAWRNSGSDINAVLRDGTRGALGKKAGRLNKVLVVSEIFLSITILILAAVFMTSAWQSLNGDFGGNTDDWVRAQIELPENKYALPAQQTTFVHQLVSRMHSSNQIGAVAISTALPGDFAESANIDVQGMEYGLSESQSRPRVNRVVQTVGSLKSLDMELIQGRFLDRSDDDPDKRNIVVTESMLPFLQVSRSPIGQQIRYADGDQSNSSWLTIVGVVEHVTHSYALHDSNAGLPSIYQPFAQAPRRQLIVAFAAKAGEQQSYTLLRELVKELDSEVAVHATERYPDFMQRGMGPLLFVSKVFLLFGLAALVLAASGIYGVMSNTILQRIQEIGVKRALGASEQRISMEFLLSGLLQLSAGAVPGLLIGGGLGFAMSGVIGTKDTNVVLISALITLFLSLVVIMATWIPTRKAIDMEPADALHYE